MRVREVMWGLAGVSLLSAAASAQSVVTVNTAEDVSDSVGGISQLPGPDGLVSLREAVSAVNATSGRHTIEFAIDRDPTDPSSGLLRLSQSAFVTLTRAGTTIDFLSQAVFEGQPDPTEPVLGMLHTSPVFLGEPGLVIEANGCTIIGLGALSNSFVSIEVRRGSNNRFFANQTNGIGVRSNFGPAITGTQVGGTGPGEGNDLGVLELGCGANQSVVVGNRITRVIVGGAAGCDESVRRPTGNRIGGPTPEERNVVNGWGGLTGQGRPTEAGVEVTLAQDTIIRGNYIGTNEDGTEAQNAGLQGVFVWDSNDTTIDGNLITGVRSSGVGPSGGLVFGRAIEITGINDIVDGVVIENNLIGTDATGTSPIPTRAGIEISSGREVRNVRIGDPAGTGGNVIAYADLNGILIENRNAQDVEIAANSIHSNGALGIDLGGDRVTPNDPGDLDSGPNGLQNFPLLDAATLEGDEVRVVGSLGTQSLRDYRIDVYASPQGDPSGHGEGERWLGAIEVTTDATGLADFDARLPALGLEASWAIASTATDLDAGATSEFSAIATLAGADPCPADLDGDGELTLFDFLQFQNLFDAGDLTADFDGDGELTLFDFLAFQNQFDAGCP